MRNVEHEVDRIIADSDPVLKAVEVGEHTPTNTRMKKSKKMLKRSSLLVVLIAGVLIASGSLLIAYSTYFGEQSGDVSLEGITADLLFDGVPMTTEAFCIDMDLSSMVAGDVFSFPHSAGVLEGNGEWDLSFDASAVTGFNPEDIFFGFYFDILNDESVSILDDIIYLRAGDPATTFDFSYALDPDFMYTAELLPYSVDVLLTTHANLPPIAVDDAFEIPTYTYTVCDVLANDFDPEGGDLDIIGFEVVTFMTTEIVGEFPNEQLEFYTSHVDVFEIEYTIADIEGLESTATVTVTSV